MKIAHAFVTASLCIPLLSCAQSKPMIWDKMGGTQAEFDRDKAACDYEVSIATQATDPTLHTMVGQELDRTIRKRDLTQKCFAARGYTLRTK